LQRIDIGDCFTRLIQGSVSDVSAFVFMSTIFFSIFNPLFSGQIVQHQWQQLA